MTTLLVASGCTQLLGIDGDYVIGLGGEASTGDSGAGGAAGGRDVAGGGSGGTTATGGRTDIGGSVPIERDSGVDASAGCKPGRFTGSLDGLHRPLVTFVGVPVTVKTGTMSFDLAGAGGTLSIQDGKFDALLTSIVTPDAGKLDATLTGSLDCASGRVVKGRLVGTIDVVNLFSGNLTGTWGGAISADDAFVGTWTEEEARPAADAGAGGFPQGGTCVPGPSGTVPNGTGCGMLTASRQ